MFARIVGCAALLCIVSALAVRGQEPAGLAPAALNQESTEETTPPVLPPPTPEGGAPPASPQAADTSTPPLFSDSVDVFTHRRYCPEVWGFGGVNVFATGNRMAPNGQTFYPLGSAFMDFNIGILPQKRLYVYGQGMFWAQKPTSGVTNGDQGNFDFSKREMDLNVGIAWRYYGPLEFRAFAFSDNNLNRGFDLNVPSGYNDGVGVENRYYIFKSNAFDLPRLNFLSLGYMPTKEITGGDGIFFTPGLFARAYLTYEFVPRKYYVYADTELICQKYANPRLLLFDDGFAARPFDALPGLEFRLGCSNVGDVQVDIWRTLTYAAVLVLF